MRQATKAAPTPSSNSRISAATSPDLECPAVTADVDCETLGFEPYAGAAWATLGVGCLSGMCDELLSSTVAARPCERCGWLGVTNCGCACAGGAMPGYDGRTSRGPEKSEFDCARA